MAMCHVAQKHREAFLEMESKFPHYSQTFFPCCIATGTKMKIGLRGRYEIDNEDKMVELT